MSRFFESKDKNSSAVQFAQRIQAHVATNHPLGSQNNHISQITSFENYSSDVMGQVQTSLQSNQQAITQTLNAMSFESYEQPSNPTAAAVLNRAKEAGIKAASIAMEAASNPVAYAQRGDNTSMPMPTGARVLGARTFDMAEGALATRQGIVEEKDSMYTTESFSNDELHKAMPYSIAWNFQAAQQSEFTEAFYPTVVITPDTIGYVAEARVQYVFAGFKHKNPLNGKPDENKRMLLEAYRDSTVLRNEAIRLIPWYNADAKGKYDAAAENPEFLDPELYFVDPTKVKPKAFALNGVSVMTAPLKFNTQPIDLLAISAHPGVTNGQFNETDQLDAAVGLKDVFITAGADKKVVHFPVKGITTSFFQKSQEGNSRTMNLNFESDEFTLDKHTVDAFSGADAITEVKAIADAGYAVRVNVVVKGDINVNTAVLQHMQCHLSIVEVRDAEGNAIDWRKDPAVKALVEALKLEPLGYNLNANRTNTNYRTQGPIVDTYSYVEKYIVAIRSPISAQRSLQEQNGESGLDTLIAMTRVRQDNDALATLFDYRDTLKEYIGRPINKRVKGDGRRIPTFIGLGKYLIEKPFYQHIELDMKKALNNIRSAEKMEDIRSIFTTLLQERVAYMYRETGLFVAHLIDNGGKAVTPHVLIGTDSYISKFLTVQGDTRLLGAGFDATVVVSPDTAMNDKIFVTFTRPEKKDFDALGFGNTLFCPELVTTVSPFFKEGATIQSSTVSPRYAHINNLPILLEIDVKNMEEVASKLQEIFAITKAA